MMCHSYAAWTLWYLGYPDQGLARSQEAVTLAQQIAHPFSLSFVLSCAAVFHQFRREGHAAQERAEAAIRLAHGTGLSVLDGVRCYPAWLGAGTAGTGEGRHRADPPGLDSLRATGAEISDRIVWRSSPKHMGSMGQPEAGLTVLAEALTLVETTGERWYEPELYRLKGELLLQQSADHQAEAETCFQQAIAIARSQQAKSWELRAATSLARLWQQQGKRQEAHDLLAPVYGWFTEGFDTADLQEAKALLEEFAR